MSPPLTNFDDYDPIKNKATIDILRAWIDNAINTVDGVTTEQAIRQALNALTGIARTTWDSLEPQYKEDLIHSGVNPVCESLYRMFVGQHENEKRTAYKRFKENRICDMKFFEDYCKEQYVNFYMSGQTNNNAWMYNTFLERFPSQL